jgi:UDP-N-acetylglucosamine 2-epimerase (non-hydrolysing)
MSTLAPTSLHARWPFRRPHAELPKPPRKKILILFGTRPEVIKLAPVIRQLESLGGKFQTINVTSAQHTDLLYPLTCLLDVRFDYDLQVMSPGQTPSQVCVRVLAALDSILVRERPDLILVQGDTTTALAGALAGFQQNIPVGHVEAGLRSHNARSPYPEEVNRRLITNLASYHFAATARNRDTLLAEGVSPQSIFVTGNPVVDSLKAMLEQTEITSRTRDLLDATQGLRRIVLTTHRRESFGEVMCENLHVVRRFVETHEDVALIFPVHPNPGVTSAAEAILSDMPRCHLAQPLNYDQFIALLSHAWLIVSDSGGVQEEAPTLGKPLLILRENTERPEAIEAGIARLVGGCPARLMEMLEEAYRTGSWTESVGKIENPFGRGDSGQCIAEVIAQELNATATAAVSLLEQAS